MRRKIFVFTALGFFLFFCALFIGLFISFSSKKNLRHEISTNKTNIASQCEYTSPENTLIHYYKLISEKKWGEAFVLRSKLSSSTLEEFKNTWSSNNSVSVDNLSVDKQTDCEAIVKARLISDEKDGTTGVYKATINLSFEDGIWKYSGGNFDKIDSYAHLEIPETLKTATPNEEDYNSTPKEPTFSPEATQSEPNARQDNYEATPEPKFEPKSIKINSTIGAEVLDLSEEAVKAILKCPKTAKFPRDDRYHKIDITQIGEIKYTVKGYVDSQNSFGAMIRSKYCVILFYKYYGFFKDSKYRIIDVYIN